MKYRDIKNELFGNNVKRPRWRRGRKWTDAEINTSDIPPLTDDFFENAQRNPYFLAAQEGITVQHRWDFLERFRAKGASYRSRLNAVWREARRRF
jgi:uncharacterized protein (DUF4415 family)